MSTSPPPFSSLITQLSQDIITASDLCAEIKKTRHVGKSHTQLDLLEASLLAGPSYLDAQAATIASLSISDENAREELENFISQLGEINDRLEHIAHPHKHHHHRHHSHRSLLFPDWDPVKHKEKEDPHFGELRAGWEKVRDEAKGFFARLAKGEEVKKYEVKEEVKVVVKEEEKSEVKEEKKGGAGVEENKDEVKVDAKLEIKEEEKKEVKEEVKVVEKKEVVDVKVDEVHVENIVAKE